MMMIISVMNDDAGTNTTMMIEFGLRDKVCLFIFITKNPDYSFKKIHDYSFKKMFIKQNSKQDYDRYKYEDDDKIWPQR